MQASPVRIDWSTLRVVDFIEVKRMSAGTLSPTERKQTMLLDGDNSAPGKRNYET